MKIVTFRQPGVDTRPTFSLETSHLSRHPGTADGHLADPSPVAHHFWLELKPLFIRRGGHPAVRAGGWPGPEEVDP